MFCLAPAKPVHYRHFNSFKQKPTTTKSSCYTWALFPKTVDIWYDNVLIKPYQFTRFMAFLLLLKIYSRVFTSYSYLGLECCGLEIRHIMHMRRNKNETFVKSLTEIIPPSRRKFWATYLPNLLFVCTFLVQRPRTMARQLTTCYLVFPFIIQSLSSFSSVLKSLSSFSSILKHSFSRIHGKLNIQ